MLLLVILSITVRCLGRFYWILWSACSLINIGANGQTWGQAVEKTRMPSTPFLCLDKCEHCLSGADVGSYFLPKKITHQHSWIQNCARDWEARGRSSCSPRSPGSCCAIVRLPHSAGSCPSALHGQDPGPDWLLNLYAHVTAEKLSGSPSDVEARMWYFWGYYNYLFLVC